jgi:hypothetical protein
MLGRHSTSVTGRTLVGLGSCSREIYLRSHSSQLVAPPVKLFRSLGDLVRMYYWPGYHCIRYRRWHSNFQLHLCTRWKLGIRSGHNHTISLALALRLLALSKGEPEEYGMLLSALWNGSSWGFHDNWRHLCCGLICYRCLQRRYDWICLLLRRQLWLYLKMEQQLSVDFTNYY